MSASPSICIIGGGPAGLAASLAFHNSGYKNINVYESRPESAICCQAPDESYPIGLNPRGLESLRELLGDHGGQALDICRLGSPVSSWDVFATQYEWRVAKFQSGTVYGTTRSAVVQILLEEIRKREPEIIINYSHSFEDMDVASKTATLQKVDEGNEKSVVKVQCDCLVVADDYRSRARDALAKQSESLVVRQWPWNVTFRVLLSDQPTDDPKKDASKSKLDPSVHHIVNGVYIATIPDGRWMAVTSCKQSTEEEQFLLSNDASDENVNRLKEYINYKAPMARHLFSDEEYRKYFSRMTFTGAVTRISHLLVNDWALIIGDAAHSAIPATGEGVNASLEDARILQQVLMESKIAEGEKQEDSGERIAKVLSTFQDRRLVDIHALCEIAYNAARPSKKHFFQSIMVRLVGGLVSKSKQLKWNTKESLMLGPGTHTVEGVMRYSDIVKEWGKQVERLGGRPSIPVSEL